MRPRRRRYPRSGAAASRRGLKVVAPAGVGDAADSRRGVKGHHGVIAFVAPRQGLDQVPLSRRAEVTSEAGSAGDPEFNSNQTNQ